MLWDYAVIAGLFVAGVLLAFPLAVGVVVTIGGLAAGLDRFTAWCPGFRRLRRWHTRRVYRPGRTVSRFVARGLMRDVLVVDASKIDAGSIIARVRTYDARCVTRGLTPPFDEARAVELAWLWVCDGPAWSVAPDTGQS